MVRILIILNVIVFFMWHDLGGEHSAFMVSNFLISWNALVAGRYWTLLTAVFSHIAVWHILINMYVLYSFGTVLEKVLGSRLFIIIYLAFGIISSFAHAAVSNYILHQPDQAALGASGAISGLVLVFALMFPRLRLYILGLIPIPALIGAIAFMGLDVWGLVAQAHGGGLPIGHGAHLGGAFAGILFYYFYIRPRQQQYRMMVRSPARQQRTANQDTQNLSQVAAPSS